MRHSRKAYTCHYCRGDRCRLTGIFIQKMDLESYAAAGKSVRLNSRPNSRVVLKFECENGHYSAVDLEVQKDRTWVDCVHSASCEKGKW